MESTPFSLLQRPMVHWPEVMVSFDSTDGVLFSADAFGSFGALDGKLFADEVNFDRDWIDDARRYLSNIVGKYGPHIQLLLKKAAGILDQIHYICPLHGPVWRKDLGYFIDKYDKWSRYGAGGEGRYDCIRFHVRQHRGCRSGPGIPASAREAVQMCGCTMCRTLTFPS